MVYFNVVTHRIVKWELPGDPWIHALYALYVQFKRELYVRTTVHIGRVKEEDTFSVTNHATKPKMCVHVICTLSRHVHSNPNH